MSDSLEEWWANCSSTAASSRSLVESMEQVMANPPLREPRPAVLYVSASCYEALHAMPGGPSLENYWKWRYGAE